MKPDLYFETVSMHITGTHRSDLIKRNERQYINRSIWVVDSGESVQQLRLSNFDLYIVCLILSCNYIQSFEYERTWCRLYQKRVVCTKLDIYAFNVTYYLTHIQSRRGSQNQLWLPGALSYVAVKWFNS
jgi:hypothetical protein